jgi:hypothetical protein
LFVNGQEGLRKECGSCHENSDYAAAVAGTPQYEDAKMAHPRTTSTPWDTAQFGNDPCVVCHMPKPTAADFPMHVWRINTDAAYSTFPTALEFGIGGTATRKNANTAPDSKGYANAVWVDLDLACGQCHNGSVAEAPVFTKSQLSGAAKGLHDGGSATSSDCLSCHSTTQGTYRPVVQGTNHHSGACTMCHTAQHKGTPLKPANYNANTWKPVGTHNPYPYFAIDSSLATFCLSCHSSDKIRSSDGATLKAIVPSGTGDNHHGGHTSVPGINVGGVSVAAGSRGDYDPGMGCLGCHGTVAISGTGDPVTHVSDYTYAITGSGLPTAVVAVQKGMAPTLGGADTTSNLCLGCHDSSEIIQSGASKNHHAGVCSSCHHTDGSYSGTFPAGVGTAPAGDPCQNCHATAQGTKRAVNQGVDHHNGPCVECHGELGGVAAMPAPGNTITSAKITDSIITSCLTCHSTDRVRSSNSTTIPAIKPKLNSYGGINDANGDQADNHHRGHSNTPVTDGDPGMYCLGCHGSASVSGSTYSITGSGLPTTTVSTQKGFATGPGADATSNLCLKCHNPIQSGPTQDHHAGTCLTCHKTAAVPGGAGATTQCIGGTPNSLCSVTTGIGGNVTYKPSAVESWENCTACHTESIATMNHPVSAATPSTTGTPSSCDVCHVKVGVIPTVHISCDQCHGGGTVATALTGTLAPGVPYKTTTELVSLKNNIHGNKPVANFTQAVSLVADYAMSFDASGSTGATSYSWSFGDGATGTGVTTLHTYSSGATVTVTLTVSNGTITAKRSKSVTPKYRGISGVAMTAPVVTTTGNHVVLSYVVSGGTGTKTAIVNWGDGTSSRATGTFVGSASHDYASLLTNITGTVTVNDSGTTSGTYKTVVKQPFTVMAGPMTISGLISSASSTPLSGASVLLKLGTTTKKLASTDATGRYTFTNVAPGTYTVVPTKSGKTFTPASRTVAATTATADFTSAP